jgi:hypothetical protein
MAARYYVLVSRELLNTEDPVFWEEAGLHLLAWGDVNDPGPSWCLFDDDNAPSELTGKKVELTITQTADGVQVSRQVIS